MLLLPTGGLVTYLYMQESPVCRAVARSSGFEFANGSEPRLARRVHSPGRRHRCRRVRFDWLSLWPSKQAL